MMRTTTAAGLLAVLLTVAGAGPAVAAANPSGTGPPSQSCQDIEAAGGTTPGHASPHPARRSTNPASTASPAASAASTTAKPRSTMSPASRSPITDERARISAAAMGPGEHDPASPPPG